MNKGFPEVFVVRKKGDFPNILLKGDSTAKTIF
jgi:hypothetical protein